MSNTRAFAAFSLLLIAASSFAEKTDPVSTNNDMYCPDLNPQASLNLEQIMEKWYVVEVIKHKIDPLHPTPSGHIVLETCPTVHLRPTSHTSLRLLWTERAGNLDYSFIIPDTNRAPGFWISRGIQNGTLLNRKYVQFVGTVQVMKAVATHMVLTFCSKTPDNQLYSILLSRERNLDEGDSTGVKNLLSRRGLTIASVQATCINGTSRKESSDVTRWITLAVSTLTAFLLAARVTTTTAGLAV